MHIRDQNILQLLEENKYNKLGILVLEFQGKKLVKIFS